MWSDGDALVEFDFEPLTDRLQRRTGAEHLADTLFLQRTRVGIGVHPTNPVRSATREQLQKILDGRISNWTALGGPDLPIRVVLVGGGGGVTVTVEAALLKGEQASAPNKLYVKTATQLFQVVEQEPGAIGFGQLGLLKQRKIA